jgi:basic membrane protein A
MKKLHFILALLIVASMVLAACGGRATPATEPPAAEQPAAEQPTAEQPAAEQPAAEVTVADCPKPEVLCVGLVTDVGKVNDKSFNQSAWEGVLKSKEDGVADLIQYIETADAKDYDKNIAQFADAGFDVIVTVGFGLGEATDAAALQYPNVWFIGVDQFQAWEYDDDPSNDIPNVSGLGFPEDQAGFLVGALAAMMSKTGVIGAVCGTDVVPPVWRFGEGYKAGAAYIDAEMGTSTEVLVVYHSDVGFDKTFTDPEWGAQTAKSMMDNGADAIFGCGGITGNGAITAAAQAGAYAIGVDTDQYFTLPEAAPRMLSSAMKLITPGVADLIAAVKNGTIVAGNVIGDAGYAPYHDLDGEVPAEVKAKMEEINAGLLNGSILTNVPPVKP